MREGATDWTDRVLELDVGAVAHGGHCVARFAGRVVFVRHALPGERVRAVVTEDPGGGYCRADAIAVLAASPNRVAAPCAWARAGGCGGCDLQHVTPAAQRAWKAAVLAEQLRRLAGIEREVTVEELPGGSTGWRTRVRLAVDTDGRAGLRAHRSHDVLPIADCPLVAPGMLPPVLAGRFAPGSVVEVAVDATATVHLPPASRGLRQRESGSSTARVGGHDSARRGPGRSKAGRAVLQRAAGREWHLTPGTFWQVHPALPDALAAVVADWADAPTGGTAWDLYGGVGLFAAVLAAQVGPTGAVHVVEAAPPAVADGRAALADLSQVRWTAVRVEHAVGRLPAPDVVVADPPRRGLGRGLIDALCVRAPARVVHVACDPAALARDVALFAGHGYAVAGLRAFDAFPMTHHLEAVALLVRAS